MDVLRVFHPGHSRRGCGRNDPGHWSVYLLHSILLVNLYFTFTWLVYFFQYHIVNIGYMVPKRLKPIYVNISFLWNIQQQDHATRIESRILQFVEFLRSATKCWNNQHRSLNLQNGRVGSLGCAHRLLQWKLPHRGQVRFCVMFGLCLQNLQRATNEVPFYSIGL